MKVVTVLNVTGADGAFVLRNVTDYGVFPVAVAEVQFDTVEAALVDVDILDTDFVIVNGEVIKSKGEQ